jgi:FkbM family methyltransferase
MKKFLKFIFDPFLGKRQWQWLFNGLFIFSLKGMNVGGGSTFSDSGEDWVLKNLSKGKKNFVLFDVGANQGSYSLLAETIFRSQSVAYNIVCFEPAKTTYETLRKNVGHNPLIQVFNQGLGDRAGKLILHYEAAGSGLASVYNRDLSDKGMALSQSEEVSMTTLDDFCFSNKVGHIDLLKLDVEGHELKALKGSESMISAGKVSAIQFEFGGTALDAGIYLRDFFRLLEKQYSINRVLKNGIYELRDYRESDELFVTTNFLALLKS